MIIINNNVAVLSFLLRNASYLLDSIVELRAIRSKCLIYNVSEYFHASSNDLIFILCYAFGIGDNFFHLCSICSRTAVYCFYDSVHHTYNTQH